MIALKHQPDLTVAFAWTTMVSVIINAMAWWHGPWFGKLLPGFWLLYAFGVAGAITILSRRQKPNVMSPKIARAA